MANHRPYGPSISGMPRQSAAMVVQCLAFTPGTGDVLIPRGDRRRGPSIGRSPGPRWPRGSNPRRCPAVGRRQPHLPHRRPQPGRPEHDGRGDLGTNRWAALSPSRPPDPRAGPDAELLPAHLVVGDLRDDVSAPVGRHAREPGPARNRRAACRRRASGARAVPASSTMVRAMGQPPSRPVRGPRTPRMRRVARPPGPRGRSDSRCGCSP